VTVKHSTLTFVDLGLGSVFEGQTCVLVEDVCDISCISNESKSSCSLKVVCFEGRRVCPLGNSACYKVKGQEVAEDWKVETHPLPGVVFLGQLQSWAFYRGGMALMDMCRTMI